MASRVEHNNPRVSMAISWARIDLRILNAWEASPSNPADICPASAQKKHFNGMTLRDASLFTSVPHRRLPGVMESVLAGWIESSHITPNTAQMRNPN